MYKNILKKYLDDLAAKKSAPGGGSAAALAGAIACGLLSMVANFTIGKEKYKKHEKELIELLEKSEVMRNRLTELVDLDAEAYGRVRDAYKAKDKKAMQEALKEATAVPLEIANLCHQAIKLCPILLEKGNENLITDVGVPAHLLKAALDSALLNVEINLKGIEDEKFILEIRKVLESQVEEVYGIEAKVKEGVKNILQGDVK